MAVVLRDRTIKEPKELGEVYDAAEGLMAAAAFFIFAGISAATSIAGGAAANKNAKAEADFLRHIGSIEADDKRRQTRRLIASQQVAFAASGVDTQVGSPLDVLGDTVAESELAALRIQFARESQGAALRQQGSAAQTQGITSGVGTVLGAAGGFMASQKQLELERLRALGRTTQ